MGDTAKEAKKAALKAKFKAEKLAASKQAAAGGAPAKQPGTPEEMAKEARKAEIKARLKAEKIAKLQVSADGASGAQESKHPATPEGKAAAAKEAKKAELKARLDRGLEGEDAATLAAVDQLGAFLQATGNLAGPSSSKIRARLLASRTLNATGQSRVTLSLRQ